MLTQERLHEVLNYDPETGIFTWKERPLDSFKTIGAGKTWNKRFDGQIAGTKDKYGYIQINIGGKFHLAHRLAWLYYYGSFPEHEIDHDDQIKYHNWISNLVDASHTCNMRNRGLHKNNTSGVKGVSLHKLTNKWCARVMVNYKQKNLGYYREFADAVIARYKAERELGWKGRVE